MKNIPLNFIKKYISEKENRKFYFTKKKKKELTQYVTYQRIYN